MRGTSLPAASPPPRRVRPEGLGGGWAGAGARAAAALPAAVVLAAGRAHSSTPLPPPHSLPPAPWQAAEDEMSKARRRAIKRATARDTAEAYIDEADHLVFEGG